MGNGKGGVEDKHLTQDVIDDRWQLIRECRMRVHYLTLYSAKGVTGGGWGNVISSGVVVGKMILSISRSQSGEQVSERSVRDQYKRKE